jgi:UDP-N-acetylmuramate dehydrogenase
MGSEWLRTWPGVLSDEPLARHSQFGIGGPADNFLRLTDTGRLASLLHRCAEEGVPVTLLGAGSNALLLDGGVRGLTIQLAERRLRIVDATTVELSGGYMMPRAALDLAKHGIAGLEFGIGIPGTCGASVRGNAGAFGTEIADVLVDCDIITPSGQAAVLSNEECRFAYRRSELSAGDQRGSVVVAGRFRVSCDAPQAVRARCDAISAQRKAGQPSGRRSLGSVFKNPPGDYAGRLVEACGLKGVRRGGAEISVKHANFILNADHATAAEVLALVALAHDTVLERIGVDLEREIVILGEPTHAAMPS